MATNKTKAVFTAEPQQIEEIQNYVNAGRYRSASELIRAAIREKIAGLRRERLVGQVARYCAEKDTTKGADLIGLQAFEDQEM